MELARSPLTAAIASCPEHSCGSVAELRFARDGALLQDERGLSDLPHRDSDAARASSDRARTSCLCTGCNGSRRSGNFRWSSFPRAADVEAERGCSRNARAFPPGSAGVSDCSRPRVDVGRAAASCDREVVAGRGASIMALPRRMATERDVDGLLAPFLHALAGGRVVALGQHVVPLGPAEPAAGDLAGVPRP